MQGAAGAVLPTGERHRWFVLAVGTSAQTAFSSVFLGVAVIAPALRAHYHLSLSATGVIIAAPSIGAILTMLLWGVATDRFGERPVSSIGLAGAAVALAGAAFAGDARMLGLLLGLAGASGASVNAATGRAVMSSFGPHERGLALGIRQTAVPIGGALAALVLPPLVDWKGVGAALVALGVGCFLAACLSFAGLRPRRDRLDVHHTAEELVHPLRDKRVWWLSTGSALLTSAQASIVGFTVLFLHAEHGLSANDAAAVLAAIQVLAIVGRIASGRLSDRRGNRVTLLRAFAVLLVCGMAAVAALANARTEVLVPVLVVCGTLAMSWNALAFTAVAEYAGEARSGVALGFQQTGIVVSNSVTPIVFAALVASTSWQAGYAAVTLCPLAALWIFNFLLADRAGGRIPDPA
jgi:nitrate/nitrite transporter NarK